MSNKITFSAFGRDSYYHREWFKKNGFKFDRSSRKWVVEHLPIEHAEDFASYCRKYGLTFERSDRIITEFDYADDTVDSPLLTPETVLEKDKE